MSRVDARFVSGVLLVLATAGSTVHAQYMSSSRYFWPGYVNPYWGYTWDPYQGYLNGAANVIQAQSQYMIAFQQGRLIKEQVRSAKIDNRRKEIEQWLWERENLPTTEDERVRFQTEQLKRVRNDPPLTEIWSGYALNVLLTDAQKTQGTELPVSPSLTDVDLSKVNVTSGKRDGNIGLLKNGKLSFPLLLRRAQFAEERDHLEQLVRSAVSQAAAKQMDAEAIEEIMRVSKQVESKLAWILKAQGDDLKPTMYVDAKNFLHNLNDALKVLQQEDAADYLNGKYVAKGATVAELVKHMTESGLKFAPASPGNETTYTALHRLMAIYNSKEGTQIKSKNMP